MSSPSHKPSQRLNDFIEHRYLLALYHRIGLAPTVFAGALLAFVIGTMILVPINLVMGGSILTGLVVNLVISCTVLPYHLYHIVRLLSQLDALQAQLYQKSIRDELTNVHNRSYFLQAIAELKDQQHNIPAQTSLLLLDLDDFKQLNDRCGHQAGDQALVQVAAACKATLRASDVFARFGGDEFVCLLPNTAPAQAQEVAERIRARIASQPFQHGEAAIPLTLSIGLATAETDLKLNELFAQADAALYQAKRQGKNQIAPA